MKATKVIMPNGKERILIEVKPKEYDAVNAMLWGAFANAPDDKDQKEKRRYDAFSDAQNDYGKSAESFDTFVVRKDDEAM